MRLSSRPEFTQATRAGEMLAHDTQSAIIVHARNHLTSEQNALVQKEIAQIAGELRLWLPDDERNEIKLMRKTDLIMLHSSLGRCIRNEFDLWLPGHHITRMWEEAEKELPLPEDVDMHICHPDNFSMLCIERLWEILQ